MFLEGGEEEEGERRETGAGGRVEEEKGALGE